ncbi:hypothetical protein CAL7716_056900 [Calothrix sp. PCC 7716]|nr:hypothetical protein CAL7716_056900 [Calothrix sp. PCC 7716]
MSKSFRNLALVSALIIVGTLISPDLAQAGELGGVDMNAYCKSQGYARANLVDLTDAGWRCYTYTSFPIWDSIDMNHVCKWQYKKENVYAKSNYPYDQNSWVCVEN